MSPPTRCSTLLYIISIITLVLLSPCNSFNLYEPSHTHSTVSRLFDRLKYHETVRIDHNQFHHIDNGHTPIYPMNGRIEFDAFGHHYRLLIRQNRELFADTFSVRRHRVNVSTNSMEHSVHSLSVPQCHYTAELST